MKKILTIVMVILLFNSCKKEEPKQYSYWTVNGQQYSSNNVIQSETKAGASIIESNGKFILRFGFMNLPEKSMFILKNGTINPDYTLLSFTHNNQSYIMIKDSVHLDFNLINGKKQYILPPTWFESNILNDSILIEATINEP